MAKELTPLDISRDDDLIRLAEEVRRTGNARLLRHGDEDLAVLSPVPACPKRRSRKARVVTPEDDAAFLAAAGSWKNFDLDQFLKDNEESRSASRPPVDL